MTTPTGTPDWMKPLPGGSKLLLNTTVNLLTAAGNYSSPIFDVAAYNGLLVEWAAFDLIGDFGSLSVIFRDAAGTILVQPTYFATWRGDLNGVVNVPVMGATAQIVVSGPQHNVNGSLSVTGHGGGGSSSYRIPSGQLGGVSNQNIGAGAATNIVPSEIYEGPAHLSIATFNAKGYALVTAFDQNGGTQFVDQVNVAALSSATIALWLPPMPLQLQVGNQDVAASTFSAGLWLGRA